MKTIGVLTSGGDAPGMNAAIRAVVRTAIYNDMKVLGIRRGYNGLIYGDLREMNIASVGDIIHRGGTILHTNRSDEFKTPEGMKKAKNIIEIFGIEGVVVLGGDGTFRGALDLSRMGIPTIGIPCTIDNDINCTDYTIGFDTATNTVVDAINKIRDTVTSHQRANVIEVMGRGRGDIALYTGVAGGAEHIIMPEVPFDINDLCKRLIQGKDRGKRSHIIMLAESMFDVNELCKEIEDKTGIETRATVLGHIQRGGSPTVADRILASRMGYHAVKLLKEGIGNRLVCIRNNQITDCDIEEGLAMQKEFDQELYEISKVLSI
ncbi:MAG: 6-phosphofructokinase [Clostridiales bacterium]|nr:6-phosphofructokinase [Clostridiales bacterium]